MGAVTLTVILGGGRGTRLDPLTRLRCKPAVPLAGKYRLIDVPISNSINSGLDHIYVLTQFNSASLNRHITHTYRFDSFTTGFVEVLAAEQTAAHLGWYQGTADAVRKQQQRFTWPANGRALILPGDQLYRMDFRQLLAAHDRSQADISVAVTPVCRSQTSQFGVLRIEDTGRIVQYAEKPEDPALLDSLQTSPEMLQRLGFADPERQFFASMGIYVIGRAILDACLEDPRSIDFGRDVLPAAIHEYRVHAYPFHGYWEDIGTIAAFYRANIALGRREPDFRFYQTGAPIYTRPRYLPASKFYDCRIRDSIISDGCVLDECEIVESVVGLRTRVAPGCQIRQSILMGADIYEGREERAINDAQGLPDIGVGANSFVRKAIIDKNARIGRNVRLLNEQNRQHADGPNFCIRDGIVVVTKNAVIPDNTVI